MPLISFDTPWKHQKTRGFQTTLLIDISFKVKREGKHERLISFPVYYFFIFSLYLLFCDVHTIKQKQIRLIFNSGWSDFSLKININCIFLCTLCLFLYITQDRNEKNIKKQPKICEMWAIYSATIESSAWWVGIIVCFQMQPPKVFCKKKVLKAVKDLCQSLCFNKVAGPGLQIYSKRDSGTGVFLWIL